MKKLMGVVLFGAVLLLTACGKEKIDDSHKKNITVGFGVSTYSDQFKESILPILAREGYQVKVRIFSQNTQLNPAMKEGVLDASVFQSIAYMEGINQALDMDMVDIAFVPSAPQGIYSLRHTTLNDVKDGTTVAIPNDPVNQERAVRILEQLGWVKVKPNAGTVNFSINSVENGQYKIDIKILDPALALTSLPDVDYAVINGNYIANASKKITDALFIEKTPKQHQIIVSVAAKNADSEWAKAIQAAYRSSEFESYIKSNAKYSGFILPAEWQTR